METEETKLTDEIKPAGPARIGFGKRLVAYLTDMLIAGIGGLVLDLLFGSAIANLFAIDLVEKGMEDSVGATYSDIVGGTLGVTVDGILLLMLAIILMEAFTGRTPGKMLIGLVDGSEYGTKASLKSLVTRALIKYIFFVILILAGLSGLAALNKIGFMLGSVVYLGFLFILGQKRQGFHDFIAKTAVFNKNDLGQQ